MGPAQATFVLVVSGPVARKAVTITRDQVIAATAPRWPRNKEFARIDLGSLDDRGASFIKAGCESLDLRMSELQRSGSELLAIGHLSLFALAPIPLLVYLGTRLSDKVQVELFQRHRDTEDWTWKTDVEPVQYSFRQVAQEMGRVWRSSLHSVDRSLSPTCLMRSESEARFTRYRFGARSRILGFFAPGRTLSDSC